MPRTHSDVERTAKKKNAASKGTYVLHIALASQRVVVVRRRIAGTWRTPRTYSLDAGHYLYVGSAQGPGGLRSRVARHLSHEKVLQWDLDFLLSGSGSDYATEAWGIQSPSGEPLECRWATAVSRAKGSVPVLGTRGDSPLAVHGFGAGDCENRCGCGSEAPNASRTHLFRVEWSPTPDTMRRLLRADLKDLRQQYGI